MQAPGGSAPHHSQAVFTPLYEYTYTDQVREITFSSILMLSLLLIPGCASIVSEEYPDPDERWRYEIRLTRKGTAREGEWGRLAYRGRELPSWFSTIVISGRRFDYLIRKEPADFLGYRQIDDSAGEEEPVRTPHDDPDDIHRPDPISERELDRGWYWADFAERKAGTPPDWVWIRRENLSAYVDPAELREFADEYELGPILREEDLPRSGVNLGLSFVTVF